MPLKFRNPKEGQVQNFYSWHTPMTYRIDCKKPAVSISSQFLKLSGLPASQTESISAFCIYKNALEMILTIFWDSGPKCELKNLEFNEYFIGFWRNFYSYFTNFGPKFFYTEFYLPLWAKTTIFLVNLFYLEIFAGNHKNQQNLTYFRNFCWNCQKKLEAR